MASEIVANLPHKFDAALQSGDLLFFPSTVSKHPEFGVEFEIRVCPALQKKPNTLVENASLVPSTKQDPFSPPYNPNLHIGDLQDEQTQDQYVVLLNKYSVIQQHFIVASKEYQPQSSPLTPTDLVTIFQFLLAARRVGRNFIAFYNCGENSGASQPHKHVQFLPLTLDSIPPVEQLAKKTKLEVSERPFSLTRLSYANHVRRFPSDIAFYDRDELESTLTQAFLQLLDLVVSTVRHDPDYPPGKLSYNIWMTQEHLHLIPRKHEAYSMSQGGVVSVNSLGFAGMLLVESEEVLQAVKSEGIGKILRGVGLESVHEDLLHSTGADALDEVHSPPTVSVL